MKRRDFITGLAGLSAGLWLPAAATAQTPARTALVEIVNFHCPRCRGVNDQFERIVSAATAAGMSVHVAPVAWDSQSLWPDRVYYAMRDRYPKVESDVRGVLFDGIQNEGLRLEDLPQVLAFLARRKVLETTQKHYPAFDQEELIALASSNVPLQSEMRAIRLLEQTNASEVPVFIWIRDGQVIDSLSPSAASAPSALVQQVIARIHTHKATP